jgi:ribosomal protein S7
MEKFSQNKKLASFLVKSQGIEIVKKVSKLNKKAQGDVDLFERGFLRLLLKMLIRDGKIERAKKIVKMFCLFCRESNLDPNLVLKLCVERIRPVFSFRVKRIAGITYRIPILRRYTASIRAGVRFLLSVCRHSRKESLARSIFAEVCAILQGQGRTWKKKQEMIRLVVLNRSLLYLLKKVKRRKYQK